MLRAIYRIAWKDLVGDIRQRSTITSMLFFVVAALIVFQVAFEPDRQQALRLLPGLMWVTALFSSMIGLGRVFQAEEEDGALEGLLLAPVPRGAVFFGKWLANVLLAGLVELLLVPLGFVLFNVDAWGQLVSVLALLWLGTIGLTGLGVLLAAVTQRARSRESLLALLLLPLVTPLLIAGIQAVSLVLVPEVGVPGDGGTLASWVRLMLIFDVVYMGMAPWAFGWLVDA